MSSADKPDEKAPVSEERGNGFEPDIGHSTRRAKRGTCPFCRRKLRLSFHHLIPRKLHRRPRYRKQYSRSELSMGIYICRDCHDAIHRRYTEMELARDRSTPGALLEDPQLAAHFAWLSRQRRRSD